MNYRKIIEMQTGYFNTNTTKDIGFRIQQLRKLKSAIKAQETALSEAIHTDFGKSAFETYTTELNLIYSEIDSSIKNLPAWAKRKSVGTNLLNLPGRSYCIPEPLGVCLIIGVWNYPYLLSLQPLVSAVAAGNTVVLKPSEIASASSAAMAALIGKSFPPEYIAIIEGGIPETTELLGEKFDKIFFSGSTSVGTIVYQAAARNLTPVTLELGGKNPAIVTRNSTIETSAKRIIWAKFLNAGQTCIAPDYVLVDELVRTSFLFHAKKYIDEFCYSIDNSNYVRIINEKNFHRLAALIDKKKTYCGGETDLRNLFIAPTIMTDVTNDEKVMSEEIFGPILPVISYSDISDAIAAIKSRPKPLACYIFTNNKVLRNRLLKEISFGGGAINDAVMHITNSKLPFGGVGNSGLGSYHGKAGFEAFSHFKSILDKPFWPEPRLKYPPYTERSMRWLRRVIGK